MPSVRSVFGATNDREMMRHRVVRAAGAANNSMEGKEPRNIEPLARSNIAENLPLISRPLA